MTAEAAPEMTSPTPAAVNTAPRAARSWLAAPKLGQYAGHAHVIHQARSFLRGRTGGRFGDEKSDGQGEHAGYTDGVAGPKGKEGGGQQGDERQGDNRDKDPVAQAIRFLSALIRVEAGPSAGLYLAKAG